MNAAAPSAYGDVDEAQAAIGAARAAIGFVTRFFAVLFLQLQLSRFAGGVEVV